MTTMLKYEFGETPADLIRERLAAWQETTDGCKPYHPILYRNTGFDDLLTVLDALRAASEIMDGLTYADADESARRLRIDILAALGIEES